MRRGDSHPAVAPDSLQDRFQELNTRLLPAGKDGWGRGMIAVTAGHHGAGASSVAFDFAAAMAPSLPNAVILVDGNLRHPDLHGPCAVPQQGGLVEVVEGELDLSDAITDTRYGFSFLAAGRSHPAPVALFASERFRSVILALRSRFVLGIFDSAPLNVYGDTPVLTAALDGAVLVLEAESTRWEVAAAARRQLEATQARLLGAVLNKQRRVIPEFIYRHL